MTITKVDANIYRGPSPNTIGDWLQLQNLGIKYALDLQTGARILGDGSPLNEQLKSSTYGIRTFCHPLGEILPPSQSEISLALSFILSFQPCYVHCHTGVDRTGMVIARYRIFAQGWNKSEAIKEMKQMGMHFWYYWWSWFL